MPRYGTNFTFFREPTQARSKLNNRSECYTGGQNVHNGAARKIYKAHIRQG